MVVIGLAPKYYRSHVPRRKMPVEPNGFAAKPSIVKWFLSGHHGCKTLIVKQVTEGLAPRRKRNDRCDGMPRVGRGEDTWNGATPAPAATQVVIGPSHRGRAEQVMEANCDEPT